MKYSSPLIVVSLVATSLSVWAPRSAAQSLHGSQASVDLMYRRAVRGGLDFYETTADIRRAVIRGELVRLNGSSHYVVSNIHMPYVRRETRAFVNALALNYHRACGVPMVITSATRPMSRKLANGSSLSVHPTGTAVDLRRPSGRCLTWLRHTLLAAERRGEIEATEERHPPHFHVAVLPAPYARVASARQRSTPVHRGGR